MRSQQQKAVMQWVKDKLFGRSTPEQRNAAYKMVEVFLRESTELKLLIRIEGRGPILEVARVQRRFVVYAHGGDEVIITKKGVRRNA